MGMVRRLSTNGCRLIRRGFRGSTSKIHHGSWVEVDFSGAWPERTQTGGPSPALGLTDLLRCLERAGEDPRIQGVLIRLRGAGGSFASALSVGRAISQLRAQGRRVAVWAEGLNDAQYLALCGADRVWLPESGTLFLLGLHTERFFLRDLLERIGARPEVVHVGRYKSAGDSLTRDSMSAEEARCIDDPIHQASTPIPSVLKLPHRPQPPARSVARGWSPRGLSFRRFRGEARLRPGRVLDPPRGRRRAPRRRRPSRLRWWACGLRRR